MSLTWRDAVTTVLVAAAAVVFVAVINEWDWPLLGSYRMGTLALGVIGMGMCIAAGWSTEPAKRDPFLITGGVLGGIAFVLMVLGLIFGSAWLFVALAIDVGILWLVSTFRHAFVRPRPRVEIRPGAAVPRTA